MKLLILLLALYLSSCSEVIELKPQIAAEFSTQVAKFQQLYGVRVNVNIQLAKVAPPRLGVCWHYGQKNNVFNLVQIDEEYWRTASDAAREFLVFHELGHCVLGLGHNDAYGTVGNYEDAPLSIMHTYNFGEFSVYRENLNYYYNELRR